MKTLFNTAILSTLRPETVIGLEDVPFSARVHALPGIKDLSYSISEVDSILGDEHDPIDVEIELRLKPVYEQCQIVTDSHIIAGGLLADDDCDSPLDHDSQGKIVNRGRRGSSDDEQEFFKAMGRDSYGDKDLKANEVEHAMLERALSAIRMDRVAMTCLSNRCRARGHSGRWADVLAFVKQVISRGSWEYAMDEIAEELFDERYWARVSGKEQSALAFLDLAMRAEEAENVWDTLFANGGVGNPLAVMLDVYEHSGVSYSVSGEGMQCRWDTSRGAAVWIPDSGATENITSNVLRKLGAGEVRWFGALGSTKDPLHAKFTRDAGVTWSDSYGSWEAATAALFAQVRDVLGESFNQAMREEAASYCRSLLKEYNAWANGECYGYVVYVIDRQTGDRVDEHDDECWGHIGMTYAETTLQDALLAKVAELSAPLH